MNLTANRQAEIVSEAAIVLRAIRRRARHHAKNCNLHKEFELLKLEVGISDMIENLTGERVTVSRLGNGKSLPL